jgi:hypothetical protein
MRQAGRGDLVGMEIRNNQRSRRLAGRDVYRLRVVRIISGTRGQTANTDTRSGLAEFPTPRHFQCSADFALRLNRATVSGKDA